MVHAEQAKATQKLLGIPPSALQTQTMTSPVGSPMTSPRNMPHGSQQIAMLTKAEESHVKADLLLVRRISSYYMHVMRAA